MTRNLRSQRRHRYRLLAPVISWVSQSTTEELSTPPLNEAGVILLFSRMMEDLGIVYESSPAQYPDMIGRIKTVRGFERGRIEFEFVSSNLFRHAHDPSGCNMIIYWENDLKTDKVEELDRCNVKILALSEIIENGPENQIREGGEGYSTVD